MDVRYFYSFVLALVLSLLLIPVLIKYSSQLHLVDDSTGNTRKLHSGSMPRSGGLGIILAAAVAVLIVLPMDESLLSFLLACLTIICFGLVDDFVELKPLQKLTGQALGVAIAMAGGMVITDISLLGSCPLWFYYGLTFIFVLGVINGVNFADGMDGLAAGISLMAMLLIFVLATESGNIQAAAIALAVSAAVMGFLRFNTHPARIFMGDSGSQFLGFVVAWLAISVSQSETTPMTTLMPLLILGIPVMDILQVVSVRIKKKLPLPGPDQEHFHHQIAKLGFYQYEVVAIIYVLQATLLGGAYLLRFATDEMDLLFYLAYLAVILGGLYWANVYGWRVRIWQAGDHHDRRNRIFRHISRLHPYSGKFFGIVIILALAAAALLSREMPSSYIHAALLLVAVMICVTLASRNRWQLTVSRVVIYTATIMLVYSMTVSVTDPLCNWLIDGCLLVLALFLVVAIRTTRREYFWLTTQDLLVLFFIVMLAPKLPMDLDLGLPASDFIFRTCVMLYACEYMLARGNKARARLTMAAIASLALIGVNS